MRRSFRICKVFGKLLAVATFAWMAMATTAQPPAEPRWSITVTTAPGLPQDVWFSGMGNNDIGWKGGGVICLNHLAQGFDGGEELTIQVDILEAGIYGVDGTPVPPGTYTFPGIDIPNIDYTVADGKTFYVIVQGRVVQSKIPGFDVGTIVTNMFMWNSKLGNSNSQVVAWSKSTTGFVPFLNEGIMKTIVKQHH